jgi:predicted alpha/beta hydrolase
MVAETIESAVEFPPFRVPAYWYAAERPRATLLFLPALGTPATYYGPLASALADRGIEALLPEWPGTGDSRPRPARGVDYGYGDLVQRYLPPLFELAASRSAGRPVLLGGHSLGAQVAVLGRRYGYVAPAGIVTLAGGLIYYRYWGGLMGAGVYLLACFVSLLCRLRGYLPGHLVGFGGPQAGRLMREWAVAIRCGTFPALPAGPNKAAPVPALSLYYAGDPMAPRQSAAALSQELGGQLDCLEAERPGNPHASWARRPQATVGRVEDWLVASGLLPPREGLAGD